MFGSASFEQRIAENIKNYELEHLFPAHLLSDILEPASKLTGVQLVLTRRHGEVYARTSGFQGGESGSFMEESEGIKIRVENRTVAHVHADYSGVPEEKKEDTIAFIAAQAKMIEDLARESYYHRELDDYAEELEEICERGARSVRDNKEDVLTGAFTKTYFNARRQVIDRAEVIPVGEVLFNINDWKYVYDSYGNEESDRLIRVVADIIKNQAKPEYVIGRTDGDAFTVLIPVAEEGEVEAYAKAVFDACQAYEDSHLAPSVAFGYIVKTNVEDKLEDLDSDLEYAMFEHKFQVKNAPGYKERLHKGV